LSADNPAITALVHRDLLGRKVDITKLWELRERLRLINKQQRDGSWRYPVKKPAPANYDLYETLNTLRRGLLTFVEARKIITHHVSVL
jgi:hypothetical protein